MPLHYDRALLSLGVAAGHPGLQTLVNEVEHISKPPDATREGKFSEMKKFREANAGQMPASAG